MSSNHRHLVLLALLALLASCRPSTTTGVRPGNTYATGFQIEQKDSAILLTIFSPWQQDQVMGRYTITKPYTRLVSNACTHVGYIKEMDDMTLLVGITDKQLVYTPLSDTIANLGNSMAPDLECILLTHPDAILLSTYAEGDQTPQRLQTLGVPVVYINEWQETHPLARAEWIRVFGALTGHLSEADSIFEQVCRAYESVICHLSSVTCNSILSGSNFRGTWYVPAGHTFMGQLFKDAGYQYRYANDTRTSSIPLTTEQVIREFENADIWVGVQASSLAELAQIDEKHTWLKAYQQGRVYNFSKRTTKTGGNDFWETGVVHPERILNDLHLIQSPIVSSDSLYFTTQLH